MKKAQTSTTAKGLAAIRAIESEKPADQRICYDPYARLFTPNVFYLLSKLFSRYGERVSPGTQGFLVCRCRYFDDCVDRAIREGIRQFVVLGSGLDSRGYRPPMAQNGVRVFEVDLPGTQASKIKLIHKVLHEVPRNVVFVPVDFNYETLDKLLASGFDRSQRALFLWEGVTYYLTAAAVDSTLSWIRTSSAPHSRVVFDYVYASALRSADQHGDIKRMQRYQRFTGEGMTYGIAKGEIENFLKQRGFHNIVGIDSKTLTSLYCVGPNQNRSVADTYAIASAETE